MTDIGGPAFGGLPLHADVGRALAAMRFEQPSPIQLKALPIALFGNDVVGQAKSGTGKTAVFGIAAVEQVLRRPASATGASPQVLILAPTREIAVQIEAVLRQIAAYSPDCTICSCIGGLPVAHDQVCAAARADRRVGKAFTLAVLCKWVAELAARMQRRGGDAWSREGADRAASAAVPCAAAVCAGRSRQVAR